MSKQDEWYPAPIRLGILISLCSIMWVIIGFGVFIIGVVAKLCYRLFNLGWGLL